jgi:asparagine synthase (glutamine-hydrolysing)
MCGICGVRSYSDEALVDEGLLRRMNDTLVHRGPDDEGYFAEPGIGLAMRRLSIIDVEGGHQPIHDERCGIWIVFNGEIYNFPSLRRELEAKGHVFSTRTDTEVVVHAYEEWGDDCTLRFNGIFAFAIWDRPRRRLLLARDHYGVKPLYYYDDGRRLSFASEIKALLADPAVPRRVNEDALDLFVSFRFVPSPWTMFDGIRKLPPGHRLVLEDGRTRVERYWKRVPEIEEALSEREHVERLQVGLEQAVRRQMLSDVPVGALLSGGIDSAVIVAIMSGLTSERVRTFSIGFKEGGTANELEDARATAAHFGTEHHEMLVDRDSYLDLLDKAVWHLDEPIGSSSALALYLVCELARPHVKVVLTGQGADEPLAGYHRYIGERYSEAYRRVPRVLRALVLRPLVELMPRQERLKRAVRSLGIDNVAQRFVEVYAALPPRARSALRPQHDNGAGPGGNGARGVVEYWRDGTGHLPSLAQMTYIDARLSLADDLLMNGDKMSMAASVEARVPFLDLDYMDIVGALPPSLRIRGLTRKYVQRQVVSRWLPEHVVRRPKRGFETPVDRWFRGEASRAVRRLVTSPDSGCAAHFDRYVVGRLLGAHIAGREDHHRQLFSLLMFELWHRKFIDPRPAPLA